MDKKEKSGDGSAFAIFAGLILGLAVMQVILPNILAFIRPYGGEINSVIQAIQKTVGYLVGFSFALSVFFIIIIIYCTEKLKEIRRKEKEMFETKVEPAYEPVQASGDQNMAKRWETVTKHIESENPNDWKQAILEADIMLDDLLTNLGYRGESMGEKLKRVDPAHFETLNDAWEAHKVRNDIAHQSNYSLNQIDARRVIQQYRKVFEEFYYI